MRRLQAMMPRYPNPRSARIGLLAAALLASLAGRASADGPARVAGLYEIRQMEMAGGLELKPDGHFRYALEYGAASERGEGDWIVSGNSVLLTSNPKPKAPDFELVKDEPAQAGELYVSLEPPGFGDFTTPLDLLVTIVGMQDPVRMDTEEDGRVPLDGMVATAVQPIVPIYGVLGHKIMLSQGGHRLLVRFQANDIGKALFDKEPLAIEDGNLMMQRYDALITFRPAKQ